jgi:pilus assembly protein CpaC
MHHQNGVPRTVLWKIFLALVVGGALSLKGLAQEAAPRPMGLTVPINGTKSLQMSTKKNLKTVTNQDPSIARVSAMADDPTRVQITGLRSGMTRVVLTDVNNAQEAFDVVVQADVEHVRTVLREVGRSANIRIIPANENTLVLDGTVGKPEEIDPILRTAQAMGFQIVNNLRAAPLVSQVQLCVVVAAVSREELRRMAFNFLTDTEHSFLGSTVGQAVVNPGLVGFGSATLTVNGVLAGTPGTPNGVPTNLFFGILNTHDGFIGFLQALRDDSVVKLLAEPKLVTMSGRPASFLSGGEQAVPVPAGLGQVGVQFEEFGTRLNFLPVVLGNGKIHLEVEPEVSNLNAAFGTSINGTVVPGRNTQRVHTTVELEDGQTFAIGGLIQREVIGTITKVPIVGDLPFIGAAFSSKSFDERETELVVLVTPRLVDGMTCDQLPRLLPGQETRSPDDFELFLECILEAPRGPRDVFPDRHYLAAYKNDPTAGVFPCAGNDHHGKKGHGGEAGCGACGQINGTCGPVNGPVGAVQPVGGEHKPVLQTAILRSEGNQVVRDPAVPPPDDMKMGTGVPAPLPSSPPATGAGGTP